MPLCRFTKDKEALQTARKGCIALIHEPASPPPKRSCFACGSEHDDFETYYYYQFNYMKFDKSFGKEIPHQDETLLCSKCNATKGETNEA